MKKYSGFTLIEMLIVMGIIIILMAVGIAGGRFAIQRAHRIQKRSAVDNIEQALWGYYTDFRQFPATATPQALVSGVGTEDAILLDYLDAGSWDGGSDGTYWYASAGNGQLFIVCGSLGGHNDDAEQGIYCTGNALNTEDILESADPAPDNIYPADPVHTNWTFLTTGTTVFKSDWYGETRNWSGT